MKSSEITQAGLDQLIRQIQQKEDYLNSFPKASFQELQLISLLANQKQVLQFIAWLIQQKANLNPAFSRLVSQHKNMGNCVLGHCFANRELFQQLSRITISQYQSASQASLLALFMAKLCKKKVILLTEDCQLRAVSRILADPSQTDRISHLKLLLRQQGVHTSEIRGWCLTQQNFEGQVVVLDLFGLNPTQYRPFLLKNAGKISKSDKIVIYHSHLQDQQVAAQFCTGLQSQNWVPLQLSPHFCPETYIQENQQGMLDRLMSNLKQNTDSPQKKDVAIFVPVSSTTKAYSGLLKEQVSKQSLKQQINIILDSSQSQAANKTNIFLVNSSTQLLDWDYDYMRLSYIVDYSTEITSTFDYSLATHITKIGLCSGSQKAKRMCLGNPNQIVIYSCLSSKFEVNQHYIERPRDLSNYILRMIVFGVGHFLQYSCPRVLSCLELMQSLKICERKGQTLQLLDRRVISAAQDGVSPIEAKAILNIVDDCQMTEQSRKRMANLMVIGMGVLGSGANLYEERVLAQVVSRKHSSSFWQNSGYLESALKIFIKCDCIELKNASLKKLQPQAQMFRRISSRASESEESTFFGSLFQLCQNQPIPDQQSQIAHFLRQNLVDQHSYHLVKDRIEHLRQTLSIQPLEIVLQNEDIANVLQRMVSIFPQAIVHYTGHKRIGYKFDHISASVRLHCNTLMAKAGQHPEYLYILGLRKHNGEIQIEFANSIGSDSVLTTLGTLPIRAKNSHGQTELEFHGISSAIFAEFVKNNQQTIRNLEQQYDCMVELKQQIALIIAYCSKDSANQLRNAFEELILKIRERISAERRVNDYQGKTKVVLRAGGHLEDIIKDKYIDQCIVSNIHPDASKEDLLELFSQFALFKQLTLHGPAQRELFQIATMHFYCQKDYQIFNQCFDGCVLFGMPLKVVPIRSKGQLSSVRPMKYIEFRWFVWASCCRALIEFIDASAIPKALEGFQLNPIFDCAKVKVSWDDKSLILDDLNSYTDQIYIEATLKSYGQIKKVEVLRYPIREETHPDQYLEKLIHKVVKPNQQENPHFRIEGVKRELNGQRHCRVHFTKGEDLMDVVVAYHQKPKILGEGRLYATAFFQKPVLIPAGLKRIYLEILEQALEDVGLRGIDFRVEREKQWQYVVLIGGSERMIDNAYNKYLKKLRPSQMQLSKVTRSLLFNDIAVYNLLYLQQKYQCRLIFDHLEKKLRVLASKAVFSHVKKQINGTITNSFFYYIRLNSHSYHHLQAHPQLIEHLHQHHQLTTAELQRDQYSLLVRGAVEQVERAAAQLMHIAESLHPRKEQMNPNVCGVCCGGFKRPYRLQACSHLFCLECLQSYFKAVLNDMNLYPVKCPQCSQPVSLQDLDSSLSKPDWQKLILMGVNRHVGMNSERMRFCYTVGCKQINFVEGPTWSCDTCRISYCNACREPQHEGIKCEDIIEIRQSDEYFKKYMYETGGRFCAKQSCRMPVVRIDGCFKVQCTRCQTCMCFKCPPDKMTPYQNANDCYAHLTSVHGGYY